jgi:hypothetical protein
VERHTTTHPDGSVTVVEVERESDWDDDDRAAAYALHLDGLEKCHQCGNPRSVCSDPNREWHANRDICFATLALAEANRLYEAKHAENPYHDGTFKHWAPRQAPGWFKYDQGVHIWISPEEIRPDDDWL